MATLLEALAGVPNPSQPLPQLLTAGQPSPRHFAALRAAGLEVVLDIRDRMEPRPFDEPDVVRAAGLDYVNVPVAHGCLTDELMERVLAVVRDNRHRSLLFHCASGNRVAGPMIAYLMLDRGLGEGDAIQEGLKMGLRGADVLEWGLDYVRRKRNGTA
jgi:protein tyrosine phosphatase (PTP) superfamily phosphohydrolase (DUF442 family)